MEVNNDQIGVCSFRVLENFVVRRTLNHLCCDDQTAAVFTLDSLVEFTHALGVEFSLVLKDRAFKRPHYMEER